MKYKMVCIDMDGTLLNSKKKITQNTKDILKKVYDEKGVHVVITTGRIYNNAIYYSNLLGIKSAVISGNGAYIKEEYCEKEIYKETLSSKQCKEILEVCSEFGVMPQIYTINHIYIYSKVYWMLSYILMGINVPDNYKVILKNVRKKEQWYKVIEDLSGDIIKVLIINLDENKLNKIQKVIKEKLNLEVHKSSKYSLEINGEGVDKGNGVRVLGEYYGVKREEIICIGDNNNDISMIKYAGLGVAMKNGSDQAKEVADYVTDSNDEDGVAKVIEKFILETKES